MPFTASHAAIVFPFLRTPLLPAGLVIGAMAPDLLYFLPFDTYRDLTHTPLGVVTIDLGIGIVVLALWWSLLRAPVIDLAPTWLSERMSRPAPRGRFAVFAALVVASIALGSITHLVWDSFTHPGEVVDALPLLNVQVGPLVLHKWLQHTSSLVGLTAIVLWSAQWVRRTGRVKKERVASSRVRYAAWVFVGATFTVAALITWAIGIGEPLHPFDPGLVFRVARVSIGATIAAAVLCCAGWYVLRERERLQAQSERSTATTLPSTSA